MSDTSLVVRGLLSEGIFIDEMLNNVRGQVRIRLNREATALDYSITDAKFQLICGPCKSLRELDALCQRLIGITKAQSAYPAEFSRLPNITEML